MTYVLDTNVISAILKGNTIVANKVADAILNGENIFINAISYYEIKRGLLAANAVTKIKKFELLCDKFGLVLLNCRDIFDNAAVIYAKLKQKGQLIGDADILIASVVKFNDFTLVSSDPDFNRIQDLKIENWIN